MNVVTSDKDDPQAALIRSLDRVSGPARLTKFLEIDGNLNGEDLTKSKDLWIEDRAVKPSGIERTSRIGVDYAREWKNKPLRFLVNR